MNLADALDTLFCNGDAAPLATLLLHRVQMEDGLALHIGRDAVIAAFLRVAAMFDGRAATLEASIDPSLVTIGWTGQLREFPSGNRLAMPVSATLRRHLWIEAEAGRAIRITAITDWAGLAGAAGAAQAPLAEHIGANHPTHRPLGELVSGRGQLATRPGDHVANLNARSLAGFMPDRRDWWLRLFARVPDAYLTVDRSVDDGFRTAILWRLQGHVAGRRVSLPGASIFDERGETGVMFDELALAATAHRPFFAL